jgi:hypothetical protein
MDNKRIQTTELDFDAIKKNLKEYMQGQSQFTDYDFEGAGLSILLDVLAYNTHYNALYQNMTVNESFLDSASKRSSVVSKAKELGYVPQSAKSATAIVNVTMINNQLDAVDSIEIPRYAQFITRVGDASYTFYTTNSHIAFRQENQYLFNEIFLKEGTLLEVRAVVVDQTSFVIPNPNVDISTLRVTVQESSQSSVLSVYSRSDRLLEAGPNTPVYFIKEIDDGLYEVEFGNGKVGKALAAGNVVTIEYISCNQSLPNGARTFTYNGPVPNNTQSFVITSSPAFGGAAPEQIDDIKWNAPRAFTAQNRCVTLDDYKTVVTSLYPNAQSINVWGGEQNIPPSYGDVFISIKPESAESLSEGEKAFILNDIIGPRRVVTQHPRIVDPEYLYVQLDTSVYYDRNKTTRTSNDVSQLVRNSIEKYNTDNLDRFDGILRYSALSRLIDASDPSIQSSITTLKIHREVRPAFNQLVQYNINIGNPIYNAGGAEESIISTGINVLNVTPTSYIDDVSTLGSDRGILRLFYYSSGEKIIVRNVGYVIYSKGQIVLDNLIITGLPSDTFKLIIKPQSNDVVSIRNQVVSITPSLTRVTPIIESDTNSYRFTPSRN